MGVDYRIKAIPRPSVEQAAAMDRARQRIAAEVAGGDLRRRVRWTRVSYDWTVYEGEDLALMEAFWDRIAAFLSSLLPERMTTDPAAVTGVNFGTGNGAIQRAWERLGHPMFGIEKMAGAARELRDYGCKGIEADLKDLSALPDASFDFGVCDRVFFNPNHAAPANGRLANLAGAAGDESVFSELRRVLKPGGALIGILYANWTKAAIEELASYGRLSWWLSHGYGRKQDARSAGSAPRKHPFLVFSVDLSMPSLALPSLEQEVAALAPVRGPLRPGTFLSGSIIHLETVDDADVALHIPTNQIVELERSLSGFRIGSAAFWSASPHRGLFRQPADRLARHGAEHLIRPNRRRDSLARPGPS